MTRALALAALAVLLAAALLASLRLGALKTGCVDILRILWRADETEIAYQILWNIRLPRVLLGALTGASLAVAGTLLQGVMRNPLASPGIIGVSSGAGLAVVVVNLALPHFGWLQVPVAFAGALATALAVYALAWRGGASPARLILSGVAIAAMLGAISGAILLYHAEKAGGILDFSIGSLSARGWPQLRQVGWYMAAGLLLSMGLGGRLNVLALGDEAAAGLGLRVEWCRFLMLATAALLAGAAVSVAGLLGFVGLLAPHLVRLALGPDHRWLLPGAALFGAFLVVAGDTVGRVLREPAELPVGMVMSLLGPPFFLWLLRRRRGA
jgi:iron complex transport system permease protein